MNPTATSIAHSERRCQLLQIFERVASGARVPYSHYYHRPQQSCLRRKPPTFTPKGGGGSKIQAPPPLCRLSGPAS